MKRLFKPAALLFYFLTIINFFFAGVYYAGLSGKGEGQGLAAGAIVLGYGVIAAFLAMIAALFLVFYRSGLLKKANRLLFAALVIFLLITTWRFLQREGEVEREKVPETKRPTTEASVLPATISEQTMGSTIGLGMFKPDFYNQQVLYFYGNPTFGKAVNEHLPFDSVVFEYTEMGVAISYAPPWFYPAHLKLDYDMLWLKASSAGMGFVEVVVNEHNQTSYFVDETAGRIFYWPEFLLSVHSVELREEHQQPIRYKPLDHASVCNIAFFALQPVFVQGDWLQVRLMNQAFKELGVGWIRWRDEKEVLLRWTILS